MLRKVLPPLGGFCAVVLLVVARHSPACGSGGTTTITNLPTLGGDNFSVFALNSAGSVGGYSSLPGEAVIHPLIFSGGVTVDIGTLGGTFGEVLALNNSGQAAGFANLSNDTASHAFRYSGGVMTDLGTLGGAMSSGNAINNSGQVAGTSGLEFDATQHAFLYSGGVMTDLGSLGGDYSTAVGINNAGTVIGDSYDASFNNFGFIYSGGVMNSVGDLGGGNYSSTRAINDSGAVVGESMTAAGEIHGFLYASGMMVDVGTLGGTFSTARAINNSGQVIGTSFNALGKRHAFRYFAGVLTDLGTLGGVDSSAMAINGAGQVVGTSRDVNGDSHAFLWQNGTMIDLNTLLPGNSGWVLQNAQFINDAGRIVGTGALNDVFQWFVLDLSSGGNNTPPVAVATPADQTVDCNTPAVLNGGGSSDQDGDALAYEWSTGGIVVGTNAMLTISFGFGDHTVTLKVTDPCGASSQTNAVVHVADTVPPVISSVPAPVKVAADATGLGATPNVAAGVVATDNCTPANALEVTQDPPVGMLLGFGQHSVVITVKDGSSNSALAKTYFTVVDLTPPVIVSGPGPITVPVTDNCRGPVPNVVGQIVATDNVTPANALVITQDPKAGTLVDAGPHPIVVTVTDAAGNSTQGFTSFTVADNQAPEIRCVPEFLVVVGNADGKGKVPNVLRDVVASDKCTPTALLVKTQSPEAGTLVECGKHVITVSVTDLSGNTGTRKVHLLVLDLTPPVIQSVKATVDGPAAGNHKLAPVTVTVNATDNCDPEPVSKVFFVRSDEPVRDGEVELTGKLTLKLAPTRKSSGGGRTYTITVRCKDDSGNSAFANTTVTVPAPPSAQKKK